MNQTMTRQAFLSVFLGLLPFSVQAETPSVLAIRQARIVPVSGPILAKGTVVVRNGLIEAVGENVPVPADAWVIEGEGLTVYPGLIDALSTWGLPDSLPGTGGAAAGPAAATGTRRRGGAEGPSPAPKPQGPETRPFNTSWLRAADLVQADDRKLIAARQSGFTSAVVFPTRGNVAGQGAVLNMAGDTSRQMVVASPAGEYFNLSPQGGFTTFPGSLMGTIAYVRQLALDLDHYHLAQAAYSRNPAGQTRPEYDKALEGMDQAPRYLLPANRRVELDRMIRFGRELNKPVVLYGAQEGYRAADLLKSARVPVLVNLKWPEAQKDADPDDEEELKVLELREQAPRTPLALQQAGVSFAFYSGGLDRPQDVVKAVKKAIDAGLPEEAAVRAMTLSAAQIYGVADRLGSIEKGKIANLVVTRGPLFGDKTKVVTTIVDGVKYDAAPDSAEEKKPEGGSRP